MPLLTAVPSVLLLKLVPGRFGLAPPRSFSLEFLANWFPAVPALPSSPRFLRIPCSKWFPGVSGLPRPATFPSSSLLKSVSCCPGLAPRHFPFEFLVQPGSRASRPRQSTLLFLRNPWPPRGAPARAPAELARLFTGPAESGVLKKQFYRNKQENKTTVSRNSGVPEGAPGAAETLLFLRLRRHLAAQACRNLACPSVRRHLAARACRKLTIP